MVFQNFKKYIHFLAACFSLDAFNGIRLTARLPLFVNFGMCLRPLFAGIGVLVLGTALAGSDPAKLEPLMKISFPVGDGPHPAVLLVSGCSGFGLANGAHYDDVQSKLTDSGYAVVRVDTIGALGAKNCLDENFRQSLTVKDQLEDMEEIMHQIANLPRIDQSNIAAIGWSWGGRPIVEASQTSAVTAPHRSIAFYPVCREIESKPAVKPLLIFSAEQDDIVPAADRELCENVAVATGSEGTHIVYPDAVHGFDITQISPPKKYKFGTIGYNENAAKDSWIRSVKFLLPLKGEN